MTVETRSEYEQLSELERARIDDEIQEDLVEHLYRSAKPGLVVALISSSIVFALLYHSANRFWLITWFMGFNTTVLSIVVLVLAYRHFKFKLKRQTWALLQEVLTSLCTLFWGVGFFLNMQDFSHQIASLAFLSMIASAFSIMTVGIFGFCIVCVSSVLMPAAIWFFLQEPIAYKLWGGVIVLCEFFLLGMNKRSTEWLINSLKLSKMLASFTHQASHDLLTDLPNQRLLVQLIDAAIEQAKAASRALGLFVWPSIA